MTKSKKRLSLRNKLMLVFGALIFVVGFTLALIAVRTARKAVTEKVEAHLIDKATDTAEIIDGRITAFFQFLEGIARMPQIRDQSVSYQKKTDILNDEVQFNSILEELYLVDTDGIQYYSDGTSDNYSNKEWFKDAMQGKRGASEPYVDETADNKLFITFSLPVYDDNRNIIGVLGADVDGLWLSKQIDDIVVGKTGECYILGLTGTTIAHKNFEAVEKQLNMIEKGKKEKSLASLSKFLEHALAIDKSEIGYYTYKGKSLIASYAAMNTTRWKVIIKAPVEEFMNTVDELHLKMIIIGLIILAAGLVIVFFVTRQMIKPIKVVVNALKDIAQGEGDLTVRLPVQGNDEVTDLSNYFNQTIAKIRLNPSVKAVKI